MADPAQQRSYYLDIDDRSGAEAILMHPEIYPTIVDDFSPKVEAFSLPDTFTPIVIRCGYDPVACLVVHPQNGVTWEVQVAIKPEYRDDSAMLGEWLMREAWEITQAYKIIAQIPYLYPNVKAFAELMGFEVEGTNKASIMKDGVLHDQWYMGISWPQQRQS